MPVQRMPRGKPTDHSLPERMRYQQQNLCRVFQQGSTGGIPEMPRVPRKTKEAGANQAKRVYAAGARRPKYRNKKTDGYDSKREAKRAQELKLLEEAGVISNLREQVSFTLVPKQVGERAVTYKADFVYLDETGSLVVEDSKGMRTPLYIVKRKLMLYIHGIRIKES